ncbi:hypothetical protein [Myxococcus sp. Y35]|uniref:hypothetical protein n=1 Tax=Pseudomyxococcus flavus TaxID=3115648 RepID=UPI003CE745CB
MALRWLFAALKFVVDHYGILLTGAVFGLIAAALLLRRKSMRAKACGALCLALILPFLYLVGTGFSSIREWIHHHGVEGELVLSRTEPSGTFINKQEVPKFVGFIKLPESQTLHPIEFPDHNLLQWPDVAGFRPQLGKPYTVKFPAAYPSLFIFDHGSNRGAAPQQECLERLRRQSDLVAQNQLLPEDAALGEALRENTTFITRFCGHLDRGTRSQAGSAP